MYTAVTAIESAPQNAPLVLRGNQEKVIRQASQLGFEGIEIHMRDPFKTDLKALHNDLNKYGIRLAALGTGPSYSQDGIFLTHDDKEIRKIAQDRMNKFIEIGAFENAVVIIGLIKGQKKDVKEINSYEYRMLEAFNICTENAKSAGVTLVVEVIDRYESDWLNTVEEGITFLKQINSPSLALHLDTFHMNIEERNCVNSILSAKGHIGHLHIADSNRWYPGHAHYDFKSTVDALKEVNYKGAVSLESFLYPDVETCCKNTLEHLKACGF